MSCPTRWLLAYGLGIVRAEAQVPLFIGSLWHEMMDRYWTADLRTTTRFGAAFTWFRRKFVELETALRESEQNWDPFRGGSLPTWREFRDARELLGQMLVVYTGTPTTAEGPDWTVLDSEVQISMSVKTPTNNRSPVCGYAGKLDKTLLVRELPWIGEHKTTKADLETYRARVSYRPQGATYALLYREQYGHYPQGIVYDVQRKAFPALPEDYRLRKDGGVSKVLPSEATAEGLAEAIRLSREKGGKDQPWYDEKLAELEQNPPVYHRRFYERFTMDELARTQRELYAIACQLRQWHMKVGRRWDLVRSRWSESGVSGAQEVCDALRDLDGEFPRNPEMCLSYGRRCPYHDLCRYREVDAVRGFRLKTSHHEELEEDDG
jgi:hypothetical protein